MYGLVVVCLLVICQALGAPSYHGPEAKPVVLPSGHLADTHEVAALKSLHLGALSQASTHDNHHHDHDDGDGHHGHASTIATGAAYHGPQAVPKVLPDGHLADTHDVAAAKEAHLAALAEAKSKNPGGADYSETSYDSHHVAEAHHGQAYHGPLAKPVVLPSGHLADTHEVAAAKGAHLEALAAQHH